MVLRGPTRTASRADGGRSADDGSTWPAGRAVRERATAPARRDERWLSTVWERQSFDRRGLRTTSGLRFKVVFPGLCTGGAGPDFRDAILALADGSLLRGDVELHLESSGWREHCHHHDPAYERVLLHVVLEDDDPAVNSAGQRVPTLELAGRLGPVRTRQPANGLPMPLPEGLPSTQRDGRIAAPAESPNGCPPPLLAQPPRALRAGEPAFTQPGFERPPSEPTPREPHQPAGATAKGALRESKAVLTVPRADSRLPAESTDWGSQQALGAMAPGTLGQREAVLTLRRADGASAQEGEAAQLTYVVAPCKRVLPRAGAEALRPLLSELALERFAAKQSVLEGELAVFAPEQALYTGLMQALGYSRNRAPFRQLAQLVPLPAVACAGSAAQIEELLLAGAGLTFAPASLLIQAGLTGETLPAGAWTSVGVRPDNLPQRRIQRFAAILARLGRSLLDDLLAPLAGGSPDDWKLAVRQHLAELGPQRIDAVAVNVLLPFAAAYGQATCQYLLAENATQQFLRYPPEGGNQITRYMRREILGDLAGVAAGAAGEQALLHIWHRWCHEKVCALCPLGSKSLSSPPV